MWYWNVKKNLEVISLIGIDTNDNEPATLWLAIRDRAARESVLRWIPAPTSTFLITLQCSHPCTGYEYKYKMIRYTSHKIWIIPDKHWRKNWICSIEESHHHPMSHPTTLRGIWRVPNMMINSITKFWYLILMNDVYHDDNYAPSHIFLVVSRPHSLEGRICRPKCSKEQPGL